MHYYLIVHQCTEILLGLIIFNTIRAKILLITPLEREPMKEITLETKIADLLDRYPRMKEILIAINPKFKKLNNPVLRRTIGRVAGVRQAAIVGGMDPMDLLNQLREAVGQSSICEDRDDPLQTCLVPVEEPAPEWIATVPSVVLDANEILDKEQNPLAITRKALKGLVPGETLLIKADFRPEPLIESFEKEGYLLYVREEEAGKFSTYVKKFELK